VQIGIARRRGLRFTVWALAASIAAACSTADRSGPADTRNEPPPEPDYRKIVAAGVKANLKELASFGPLEMSAIRRSAPTQYGDWTVCVKGRRSDRPVYFSAFLRDHAIITFGESVGVDRCADEQYEPLPPDEPVNTKPAAPAKPRR
jgi:hypothetical protein